MLEKFILSSTVSAVESSSLEEGVAGGSARAVDTLGSLDSDGDCPERKRKYSCTKDGGDDVRMIMVVVILMKMMTLFWCQRCSLCIYS